MYTYAYTYTGTHTCTYTGTDIDTRTHTQGQTQRYLCEQRKQKPHNRHKNATHAQCRTPENCQELHRTFVASSTMAGRSCAFNAVSTDSRPDCATTFFVLTGSRTRSLSICKSTPCNPNTCQYHNSRVHTARATSNATTVHSDSTSSPVACVEIREVAS